jgi:hypothetical protein
LRQIVTTTGGGESRASAEISGSIVKHRFSKLYVRPIADPPSPRGSGDPCHH